jgi:A/G-specific adenine glycosylase
MDKPKATRIRKSLLTWWDRGRRDLPWRRTKDPYAVWVSEIMLQQTRIDTVIPYYHRFLSRLPTVESLARARLDSVLKLWEGLGYYSRARNLHKAARVIVQQYGGRFPQDVDGLLNLPGIGRYTAGAIASIAFGRPAAVVDGNIIRLLCRLFCIREDPTRATAKNRIWQLAEELVCTQRPGDLNQSMMELGSQICKPLNPDCPRCPVKRNCLALKENLQHDLPRMPKAQKLPQYTIAVGIVFQKDRVLIGKRRPDGMLGGLWEFPGGKKKKSESLKEAAAREIREETGVEVRLGRRLMIVRHAYSHFKIVLHAYLCDYLSGTARPLGCQAVKWVPVKQLSRYAFPSANQKIIKKLHKYP